MTLEDFVYGANNTDKNRDNFMRAVKILDWNEDEELFGIRNINYTVGEEK
jgi:hypothetical protein